MAKRTAQPMRIIVTIPADAPRTVADLTPEQYKQYIAALAVFFGTLTEVAARQATTTETGEEAA